MDIKKYVEAEVPNLIAMRRHFHEYPEGSQQEFKTMEYIEAKLKDMGLSSVRVPRGGILATIDSGKPGYTMLMRADIDALPVQEDAVNLSKPKVVVSKNKGYCHACGHDGHMAMLLTEGNILAEHTDEWEGKVILMFEQSEEFGERGGKHLLQYIQAQGIHVDTCYATHVRWDIPVGKMTVLDDGVMSGAFFFRVKVHGKGGHGSRPDLSVNPIDAFIAFGAALQSLRMRAVAPDHCLTYSFGALHAGQEPNIIPPELTFAGSCRFFDNKDGEFFREKFHQILDHVCEEYGVSSEMQEEQFLPVTMNDKTCAALARNTIAKTLGEDTLYPTSHWMASETFGAALAIYPGILAFTGINDSEVGSGANHHNAKFDIGEKGLITGVESALAYVLAVLKDKPDFSYFKAADLNEIVKRL